MRERERERERENKKRKIETSFGGAIIEILAGAISCGSRTDKLAI